MLTEGFSPRRVAEVTRQAGMTTIGTMLLIIHHLKSYLISFNSVIARLDWAIQKKGLDYPVKRLCRNYLEMEYCHSERSEESY